MHTPFSPTLYIVCSTSCIVNPVCKSTRIHSIHAPSILPPLKTPAQHYHALINTSPKEIVTGGSTNSLNPHLWLLACYAALSPNLCCHSCMTFSANLQAEWPSPDRHLILCLAVWIIVAKCNNCPPQAWIQFLRVWTWAQPTGWPLSHQCLSLLRK